MLLFEIEKPFNSPDYIFELKWDGYRALAFINDNNLLLQSRNQKNLTPYFSELKSITSLFKGTNAVLDGEICYLNRDGKPVFEKLQGRIWQKKSNIKYPVTYITWDILGLNNNDLTRTPLLERKKILQNYIQESNRLKRSKYIKEKGKELYEMAEEEGLEGIVAKKVNSPYEFKRSKYWYKIKIWQYTTAVIVGFTRDKEALLVGKYLKDNNKISFMGRVKIALNEAEKKALFRFLPTLKVKKPPFKVRHKQGISWVKPAIQCKVKYTEITSNNTFRHGFVVKLKI
ncbi:ATP dependent DNA ligase [Halothermothrix orenii H 168]|uniref:DNA ligase (ATP) n=2 Tax=Halothermothrix orenii TaxID=31909 RepID=B8D1M6_HALOH|nr:ATP dependent DNA ligase [Halothermothrix orenii H 168]